MLKKGTKLDAFVRKCLVEIVANTNQEVGNINNHMVSLFGVF